MHPCIDKTLDKYPDGVYSINGTNRYPAGYFCKYMAECRSMVERIVSGIWKIIKNAVIRKKRRDVRRN